MVADYFTKPLQGTAFRQFRDQVMNVDGALPLVGAPIIRDPALTHGGDRRSVLDNEENVGAHGWTKVVRERVRNRRTKLQTTGVGLQPTGVGLQQTGVGLQQTGVGLQPNGVGLQPTAEGLQSTDVRKRRAPTGGHTEPRKTTRSKKERKVEKR
jgi:hypothetical protein